ncbi:MAG: YfhO family protein [Anaerolineaceae bacterium]|nr:YfhO family protein [Anaerolineaceae bacterium]
MYFFLRSEGKKNLASLCGGVMFECLPQLYAHYGAGHLTMVYAVCWLPWLFWAEKRRSNLDAQNRNSVLPGGILGIMVLADIRTAAFAAMGWTLYGIFLKINSQNKPSSISYRKSLIPIIQKNVFDIVHWLPGYVIQLLVASLLAAPLLLPLEEFTRFSTRQLMTPSDILSYSLPPIHLLGLIIPDMGANAETITYCGALAVVLFLWILIDRSMRGKNIFWIGFVLLAFIYSLGSALPFSSLFARLPGFSLLRVPARMIFMGGFGLAVLVAAGIEVLSETAPEFPARVKVATNLVLTGLSFFVWLLAVGVWFINKSFPIEFVWGAASITIFSFICLMRLNGHLSIKSWTIILLPILVLDLATVDFTQIDFHDVADVNSNFNEITGVLGQKNALYRVYSPSYSLPQNIAADHKIELADGIDPLQLQSYVNFMKKASGVPSTGYSVTMPPFASGMPQVDNIYFSPDANALGILNVKYIVSNFDLHANGLVEIGLFDNTHLYENQMVLPRAWVQPETSALGADISSAQILLFTPNMIRIAAQGPGVLVLSEINYPGWDVSIDGKKQAIENVDGLLRGVRLETGYHKITFAYHPWTVTVGLMLSGFLLAILVFRQSYSRVPHKK